MTLLCILTFNALVKNTNIYTLNHDIASLRQIAKSNEFEFKTSSRYYLDDRKQSIKYDAH